MKQPSTTQPTSLPRDIPVYNASPLCGSSTSDPPVQDLGVVDTDIECDVPMEKYRYIKYNIQIDFNMYIYIYMDYVGYLSQACHNPVSSIILKERTIRNSRRFQTVKDDSDMFCCSFNTQSFSHFWGEPPLSYSKIWTTGQNDLVLSFKQRVL